MSLKANLAAKFGFLPRGSQVLVVLFGLTSAISAFVSMRFILFPQPYVWLLPLTICVGFGWLAYQCWRASHVNADTVNAVPVSIAMRDGSAVSMDPRLLASPGAMGEFAKILQMVNDRALLPKADGMVTSKGVPDHSRIDEADRVVAAANTETRAIVSQVITGIGALGQSQAVGQPCIGKIDVGDIIDVNKTTGPESKSPGGD